jgi:radical SAM protein with 4Fe4S-binding SPASM domain
VGDRPPVESMENLARAFAGSKRISLRLLPASGNGIVRPAPGLSALGGCIGNLSIRRKSIRQGESAGVAANPRSFLLMPDGAFALCWDGAGIDATGPSLPGPEEPPPVRRARLMDWNPYGTPPCSECRRLPTCGGGCPRIWALTGRHECAFGSDADYLHFVRTNLLSPGPERADRLVEEACDPEGLNP